MEKHFQKITPRTTTKAFAFRGFVSLFVSLDCVHASRKTLRSEKEKQKPEPHW